MLPRAIEAAGIPLGEWAIVCGNALGISAMWVANWWPYLIGFLAAVVLSATEHWWRWIDRLWRRATKHLGEAASQGSKSHHSLSDARSIVFLLPENAYQIYWDSPGDLQIITRPDPELSTGRSPATRLPVFRLKNVGSVAVTDLQVRWTVEGFDLKNLQRDFAANEAASLYLTNLQPDLYEFSAKTPTGTTQIAAPYKVSDAVVIPFLVPTLDNETFTDAPIPASVWSLIELLLIPSLYRPHTYTVKELELSVILDWETPSGDASRRFTARVFASSIITASNTSLALVETRISFNNEWRAPPAVYAGLRFVLEPK